VITQLAPAERYCFVGTVGSGKSYRAAREVDGIRRVVLWQPMGDWRLGRRETVYDFEDQLDEYRKGALRVTVEPTSYDPEEMRAEYERLCAAVYDCGALTFVSEEISLVATPNDVPGELSRLAVRGRHRAVSMVTIGQRFAQFPLIVRGTASRVFCFRQTDPADVKGIRERFQPYPLPQDPSTLPDRVYLDWQPLRGVTREISRP
jgi:hypothetical protein